jgi:hypothetical protein
VIKRGTGRPQEVRRSDDEPGADHADERETVIDWRGAGGAPRWLLLLALVASIGVNTLLGTMVVGLVLDRFSLIERAQKEPLWDLMAKMSTVQAEQGVKLKQHEEALRNINILAERMADTRIEVQVLNERLRRKGM